MDSILIDEARTPLIISGQADDNIQLYRVMDAVPAHLIRQETEEGEGDYWVDEKAHQVILSEAGHEHAEQILTQMGLLQENDSLYSAANISLMHHLMAALRAHTLFHKDQHYVIQDGEIVIVDEFTGRLMAGRRWSEGLHQAVEAKEGVEIKRENQTLASITFQNYFRLYSKLSGMTGTADTEAFEFQSIYNLETVIIPTNRPVQRKDFNDQIFRSAEEKFEAVVKDIAECHKNGQPVLVGTTSIENSELVSDLLHKAGLPHNVLNAKEHEREALIVAQAGKVGAITVATNMAGRGTVIGTERHESRRIDNQLRGRAGRQGDPGSSRFYLSFEDPLLRLFALDRASAILNRLAPERGVAIEHGLLTRQIEGAQRKVEGRNFDMRKQVLEYDDVANDQRKVIYHQRNEILTSKDVSDLTREIRADVISDLVDYHIPPDSMEEQWDIPALEHQLAADFRLHVDIKGWLKEDSTLDNQDIKERLIKRIEDEYAEKVELVGKQAMSDFERNVMLQVIDNQWREHLAAMDYLRQGIHLRSYAQKNPKQEYKREAFAMFENLWRGIKQNIAALLTAVQIERNSEYDHTAAQSVSDVQTVHSDAPDMEELLGQSQTDLVTEAFDPDGTDFSPEALAQNGLIVHRNDPCPCGSGLKYKQCHGKLN